MANIKLTVDFPIYSGLALTFQAPCNCSAVTGLKVYYKELSESAATDASMVFEFRDAHCVAVTNISNLFAQNALVKVVLDVQNGYAYIQNADTNSYLEEKFGGKADKPTLLTGSLTVAGWTAETGGFKQALTISGLATSGYTYTVYPNSSQYKVWTEAGIYADDVTTANSITFHCTEKPTVAVSVNIKKEQVG